MFIVIFGAVLIFIGLLLFVAANDYKIKRIRVRQIIISLILMYIG